MSYSVRLANAADVIIKSNQSGLLDAAQSNDENGMCWGGTRTLRTSPSSVVWLESSPSGS